MMNIKNAPPPLKELKLSTHLQYALQKLGRNIPCYLLEGGQEEVIRIEFVFKAGKAYENKPLVANSTLYLSREGTEKLSSDKISETLDFYGSEIGLELGMDRTVISLVSLFKFLPKVLPTFMAILQEPSFDESELSIFKARSKAALKVNLEKVRYISRLKFSEFMFRGHPYQETVDPQFFDEIKRSDLAEFFERRYSFSNAYVVVSGKNADKVFGLLNEYDFNCHEIIEEDPFPNWDYQYFEEHVKLKRAIQSSIRIGAPCPSRNDPNYPSIFLMNMALGGYFGSRLMQNIREDKGYTYGISSFINNYENESFLVISTEVGSEYQENTLIEIKKEMSRLKDEPISEVELRNLKNFALGRILQSFDGPFLKADRLKLILNHSLESNYFETFVARLEAVNPEELQLAASHFLDWDRYSKMIVGN